MALCCPNFADKLLQIVSRHMYLARRRFGDQIHYAIRESYQDGEFWKSRHLLDLGTDPSRYIHYPGGNGYYYAPEILDSLAEKGLHTDQSSLDTIFFEFLSPHIQRVIHGFDRGRRIARPPPFTGDASSSVHTFDKRRFHFLRFGARSRQQIHRQPINIFRSLQNKSRDELEQLFLHSEASLRLVEKAIYVATIFELNRFVPDPHSDQPAVVQLDCYFMDALCRLACDRRFWFGEPEHDNLSQYLVKYAIIYFDYERPQSPATHDYIRDFIYRHRTYRPPKHVQQNIRWAEKIFELSWEELKRLPKASLSRRYRRLSLKHHPDHGGDPAQFDRLTQIYKHLLKAYP
jgi:hypothetical protein